MFTLIMRQLGINAIRVVGNFKKDKTPYLHLHIILRA